MKRAVIDEVTEYDSTSRATLPKLVEFASGDGIPSGAKFRSWQSKADGSRVLTANTSRLHYINRSPPQNMMLAIVNRSTGKARLVPLEACHLSATLPDIAPVHSTDSIVRPTRKEFGLVMGLARSQKMQAKSEKFRVDARAASVGASLSEAVNSVSDDLPPPEELAAEPADEGGLIPRQNREATSPSEVYSRDDVMPPKVWSRLLAGREQFKQALERGIFDYEYVSKYAPLIEQFGDTDKYAILSYVTYMLRLLRYLQPLTIKKKWTQLKIPEPIMEHLRDTFMECSQDGWGRSERLNAKLVCYIVVGMLWLHDFKLDLNEVSTASRIQLKRLKMYCAVLGLTVVGDSYAELKLPLKERFRPTNMRRTKRIAQL